MIMTFIFNILKFLRCQARCSNIEISRCSRCKYVKISRFSINLKRQDVKDVVLVHIVSLLSFGLL